MNSDNSTDRTPSSGAGTNSVTPSTAFLNRKLGSSPAPRMLTPSAIKFLQLTK